ncbi:MAG: hypothetical protein ACETWT_11980 [Thermodesulfobacteriota bacterium]
MRFSEVLDNSPIKSESVCFLCGKEVKHGGHYCGEITLTICSDCIRFGDLQPLGIVIGDAILDMYTRNFPRDRICPATIVEQFLKRLEGQIFKTIAGGLYISLHNSGQESEGENIQ